MAMASFVGQIQSTIGVPTVHYIISGTSRMKRRTNRRPTVPHGEKKPKQVPE
jgi:hypothetical protein